MLPFQIAHEPTAYNNNCQIALNAHQSTAKSKNNVPEECQPEAAYELGIKAEHGA
jgi:hypothetical protein